MYAKRSETLHSTRNTPSGKTQSIESLLIRKVGSNDMILPRNALPPIKPYDSNQPSHPQIMYSRMESPTKIHSPLSNESLVSDALKEISRSTSNSQKSPGKLAISLQLPDAKPDEISSLSINSIADSALENTKQIGKPTPNENAVFVNPFSAINTRFQQAILDTDNSYDVLSTFSEDGWESDLDIDLILPLPSYYNNATNLIRRKSSKRSSRRNPKRKSVNRKASFKKASKNDASLAAKSKNDTSKSNENYQITSNAGPSKNNTSGAFKLQYIASYFKKNRKVSPETMQPAIIHQYKTLCSFIRRNNVTTENLPPLMNVTSAGTSLAITDDSAHFVIHRTLCNAYGLIKPKKRPKQATPKNTTTIAKRQQSLKKKMLSDSNMKDVDISKLSAPSHLTVKRYANPESSNVDVTALQPQTISSLPSQQLVVSSQSRNSSSRRESIVTQKNDSYKKSGLDAQGIYPSSNTLMGGDQLGRYGSNSRFEGTYSAKISHNLIGTVPEHEDSDDPKNAAHVQPSISVLDNFTKPPNMLTTGQYQRKRSLTPRDKNYSAGPALSSHLQIPTSSSIPGTMSSLNLKHAQSSNVESHSSIESENSPQLSSSAFVSMLLGTSNPAFANRIGDGLLNFQGREPSISSFTSVESSLIRSIIKVNPDAHQVEPFHIEDSFEDGLEQGNVAEFET